MPARDPISVIVKNIMGKLSKYKMKMRTRNQSFKAQIPNQLLTTDEKIRKTSVKMNIYSIRGKSHRIMHHPKYMLKYKFHFFRKTSEESCLEHKPNF